jgi:esterase/lipase superfamily enzyme
VAVTAVEKTTNRWHSQRTGQEMLMVRWGHFGVPVLVFPTAGGDAEEIERMLMIQALTPLLAEGRIKVYSIDSVAARNWGDLEVSGQSKAVLLDAFQQYVRHEVVPAIRNDCDDASIGIVTAGASIGAFNAISSLCRFPEVFERAICMSGSYDVERFMKNLQGPSQEFHFASPLRFLPDLQDGPQLETLRSRYVLMAHGGGQWEDPEQDWKMASLLGSKGIPNLVEPWGEEYDHDWPTWRAMLPKYLAQL